MSGRILRVAVAVALALIAVAVARYPGLLRAEGLSHVHLCDLAAPRAANGEANPVGRLAVPVAQALLALATALAWWRVPRLFARRSRLTGWVPRAGLLSAAGQLAVPFTITLETRWWHPVAIFAAAIPGLLAQLGATWGLLGDPTTRRLGRLGGAVVAAAALDLLLYALQGIGVLPVTPAVPLLQHLALLLLAAWLVGVAGR